MKLRNLTILFSLGLTLLACGGGSEDEVNNTPVTGKFIDSAVEGLSYKTETQNGLTDSEGKFTYIPSETVTFSIGDISLGSTKGEAIITPVNLIAGAEDENNENVLNIARVLQTLDKDGDPDNGIFIDELVRTQAKGKTIDFTLPSNDFEDNGDIQTLISDLTSSFGDAKTLVSSTNAKSHLKESILSNFANDYYGTFTGDDSGEWAVVIDDEGNISGKACSSVYPEVAVSGNIATNGSSTFSGTAGIATFTGSVSPSGVFSGTWENSEGEDGNFTGAKYAEKNDCTFQFNNSGNDSSSDSSETSSQSANIDFGILSLSTDEDLLLSSFEPTEGINESWDLDRDYTWTRKIDDLEYRLAVFYDHSYSDPNSGIYYLRFYVKNYKTNKLLHIWSERRQSGIEGLTFDDETINLDNATLPQWETLNPNTKMDTGELILNGSLKLPTK